MVVVVVNAALYNSRNDLLNDSVGILGDARSLSIATVLNYHDKSQFRNEFKPEKTKRSCPSPFKSHSSPLYLCKGMSSYCILNFDSVAKKHTTRSDPMSIVCQIYHP